MFKNEILECPKCKNRNIKKRGLYYQCSAMRGKINHESCGYIAPIEFFRVDLLNYDRE